MQPAIEIKSTEIIGNKQLICYIENKDSPCGSIDFISEKINFNISGASFSFKGMEYIKNITLEYTPEELVFIFSNKKKLLVNCHLRIYEKISTHIKNYEQADNNQRSKDTFLND